MSRNPLVAILMVVFGLILLLPGICALAVTTQMRGADPTILIILIPCLGISALGVLLIVRAFR